MERITPQGSMTRHRPSIGRQAVMLSLFLFVTFLAAALGAWATSTSVNTWYRELQRPAWTPPGWLFGPVWTTLYTLMAIAAWLVWRRGGFREGAWPLALYGGQLALNVLWSVCFFGLRNPGLAFGEILVLWVAIALTAVAFFRKSTAAAALLIPYLAWSTFAAFLNYMIWRMNA